MTLENTLILPVDGMHCGSCVARVETALRANEGVTDVSVSLANETARVTWDGPARAGAAM